MTTKQAIDFIANELQLLCSDRHSDPTIYGTGGDGPEVALSQILDGLRALPEDPEMERLRNAVAGFRLAVPGEQAFAIPADVYSVIIDAREALNPKEEGK